jgi:sulfur-oxidizing protein SoxY
MNTNTKRFDRRQILKAASGLGIMAFGASMSPMAFAAWNGALGAGSPSNSGDVQIIASDIAENGAVVPIQAVSKLANTEQISILVEKNPSALVCLFNLTADVLPEVTTRIKMGQTSNVTVLVKAGGKYYTATKEIKVTLGGCGG